MGEVGKALFDILDDAYTGEIDSLDVGGLQHGTYDILHICFPYSDKFIESVKTYQSQYEPKYTVIHSTVPVGTSRACGALHSPIRGLHPDLTEGIRTFPKFIGGDRASLVADYFRRAGLKVILCDRQETTELGKLLDTEYYRACIDFTKKAKELADKHGVPFHEAYTLFNMTYNEGYTELGHSEYVRPVLQPIMTEIGGHCVMPNKILIEKES